MIADGHVRMRKREKHVRESEREDGKGRERLGEEEREMSGREGGKGRRLPELSQRFAVKRIWAT